MMNILIIKLGAIGDVLRTTSVAPALKEKYPGAKIDWVTKENAFDLIKNNPHIDNIFSIEKYEKLQKKYGLVVNFDDEESACKLATEVQKNKLVGAYIQDGQRTYTDDAAEWFDMGLISKFGKKKADELKAANKRTYHEIHFTILDLKDDKKHQTELFLDKENLDFAHNFASQNNIAKDDLIVGINTGAGGRWQDKKLSIEETASLIDKLNNGVNAKLLLFGGPVEKERNQKIKDSISQKSEISGNLENSKNFQSNTEIIDTGCDNSLMEFASLINLCDILITSDSLAMHIGIALKKKIVVFFYPTSEAEIELYDRGIKIIGKGNSYCSYQTKCDNPPKWDIDEMVGAVKKLV